VRQTFAERVFNGFNVTFMVLLSVLFVYPFVYVLAVSLNDGMDAMRGGIYLFPRVFTLKNYTHIFENNNILAATAVRVYRTVLGTCLTVLGCSTFAYALRKRDLPGRKIVNWLIIVPFYFSAGVIPTFMLFKGLGLVNNLLVYVIPGIYSSFNVIFLRTYFKGMPDSLEESAVMDGANYVTIYFRIFFPLSVPALATIALLTGVGHWNDWFAGMVYIYTPKKWPLQTLLLNILQGAEIGNEMVRSGQMRGPVKKLAITVESIKMSMLMITVIPIVCIYPFLQRYFVTGLLIGSLKG